MYSRGMNPKILGTPKVLLCDLIYGIGQEACGQANCTNRSWGGEGTPPALECSGWITVSDIAQALNRKGEDASILSARMFSSWRKGSWVRTDQGREDSACLWKYHVTDLSPLRHRADVVRQRYARLHKSK